MRRSSSTTTTTAAAAAAAAANAAATTTALVAILVVLVGVLHGNNNLNQEPGYSRGSWSLVAAACPTSEFAECRKTCLGLLGSLSGYKAKSICSN